MPTASALSIYAFAATSFIFGASNLLWPLAALESFGLPAAALPPVQGNGLAAVAMGIYYSLAAYQRNRAFMVLTVPMRLLTASVFWGYGGVWRLGAWWEGGGAVLTAAALLWERSYI
ncbi:uncharacterized protein GIQ15_00135 [Arthroderma uncinatum]|uniref:uncharacterized protein n=1 Tax=Arthroderma uncinatum TaxID=74035 RepID=UPI00144A63BB|nr:uncharacterized protein GIQ15_00135 [Arthroderma uncinatum]KAF3490618.1 hypothetical protein GIQ15_00135 [Arthroderma uncinatum]